MLQNNMYQLALENIDSSQIAPFEENLRNVSVVVMDANADVESIQYVADVCQQSQVPCKKAIDKIDSHLASLV